MKKGVLPVVFFIFLIPLAFSYGVPDEALGDKSVYLEVGKPLIWNKGEIYNLELQEIKGQDAYINSPSPCRQYFFQGSLVTLEAFSANITWVSSMSSKCSELSGSYDTISDSCTFTFNGPLTVPISFTYSQPANQPPSVSLISPTDGYTYFLGEGNTPISIDLYASASDIDETGSIKEVKFYNGGTEVATGTYSTSNQRWESSWAVSTTGTYTLTAKATDNAGGITTSPTSSITVYPAPITTIALTLGASNADGRVGANVISATGGISCTVGSNCPQSGLVNKNSQVTLTASPVNSSWLADFSGVTGCSSTSQNSCTIANIGDQNRQISVPFNYNPPANQPPSVSFSWPNDGATYTAPASISLEVSASDPDLSGSIKEVKFYNGGTNLIGSASYNEVQGRWIYSWTNVPAGSYTLTAKATDNAGGITTSSTRTITVSPPPNQFPTVQVTSPLHESTYTAGDNVQVTASASDSDGTILSVQFFRGSTSLGTDTNGADGWSTSWNNVQVGSYSITAKATDNSGATVTSSPITVSVNNAPPTTLTFTLDASNTGGTGANSVSASSGSTTVSCTVGSNCPQSGTFTRNSQVVITASPLANWVVDFSSTGCTSVDGNTCTISNIGTADVTKSVTFTYVPPNQPPSISFTSPSQGSTYTAPASIIFGTSASDSDGTITKVEFYNGGTLLGTDTTSPYSYSWTNVPVGSYSITAIATDDDNSITSTSRSVYVKTTPTISLSKDKESYTEGDTLVYTATISDPDSIGVAVNPTFWWGSTQLSGTLANPSQNTWTLTVGNLYAGSWSGIYSKYTDNLDYERQSNSITVTVNANVAPSTSLTSPDAGAVYTDPATVNIAATASDSDGTITKVEFYNGGTLLGTDTTSPYSYSWTNVPAGTYSITSKAYDNKGATGTSSARTITVSAPTTSLTLSCSNSDSGDTVSSSATITVGSQSTSCSTSGTTSSTISVPQGTSATITVTPGTNRKVTWPSLGGTASGNTYTFTTSTSTTSSVSLSFSKIQYAISISISNSDNSNTYSGVVTSSPGTITCSADVGGACSDNFDPNTLVDVTASPASGWTASISCSCSSCTRTPEDDPALCHVTMNANKGLSATFSRISSGTGGT